MIQKKQKPNLTPIKVIGHGAFGKLLIIVKHNLKIGYVFEAYDNNLKCKVALKRT